MKWWAGVSSAVVAGLMVACSSDADSPPPRALDAVADARPEFAAPASHAGATPPAVAATSGTSGIPESASTVAPGDVSAQGFAGTLKDVVIRSLARPPAGRGFPPPQVAAASAIVMDEATGALLYELNPHIRLAPASLTKIATAMLVLEAGGLDREIEVHPDLDRYWLEDSATMGLEPGDRFTVRELLYGLLLASGNDAADALAEHTAGNVEAFVVRMNVLTRQLGLVNTNFTDPHGLGGPGHYSSAFDMARLARYAMKDATFREIVATETHIATGSRSIELYKLHPLLNYTHGVDGVKTGFTEEAGKTMVASVTRNGHCVYVVLLNAPSRAEHTIALIEWTFANYTWE